MRVAAIVILAFAACASAKPGHVESKLADKEFVLRQKMVLELYAQIHQPSLFENVYNAANKFNFEAYKTKFAPVHYDTWFKILHRGLYPRGEIFTITNEEHKKEAIALFYMLYTAVDFDTFYSFSAWARQHVNEQLFTYSLTVAILHREDTRGMYLPAPYEVNPSMFVNSEVLTKANYVLMRGENLDEERMKHMNIEKLGDKTFYFYANYTGWYVSTNEEQKMSYFTEDVGLNAYNYFFHVDYPEWMDGEEFGLSKDRRGELEYYYYQQILARYYLERLSNDLGEIPNIDYRQPIKTGYYPGLRYQNGLDFPQRPNNYLITEDFEELKTIEDYEKRIRDIINLGYIVMPDGTYLYLKDKDFFNEFATIIFRNVDSPNYYFYKNFLWIARDILGTSFELADATYGAPAALENFETALRDPVFYQLYKRVLKYFAEYKKAFYSPYTAEELKFPGVNIKDVEVDKLVTFFEYFEFQLYNGLTLKKDNYFDIEYKVRQLRLNNQPFSIKIHVDTDKTTDAVVRVFLGPKYDSYGRHINLDENRYNFFELDIFHYNLKSGKNIIERKSEDFFHVVDDYTDYSTIYQDTIDTLAGHKEFYLNNTNAHFGFPERMLLPKGKKGGMEYQLFVIVSPYNAPEKEFGAEFDENIWSGVGTGARYIDSLPMGYPFDRFINEEFDYPNMYFKDVIIFHKSKYELNRPYYFQHKEE